MSKIPVIIDCDTGIDDAMALVVACASDNLDIRAVTTVGGNVSLENTTRNTLNVLHLLGFSHVPVAKGADKPLQRPLMKASRVHGVSGLRGYEFAENYTDNLVDLPAWDLMRQVLMSSEEKVTIIALAPVTNLAILLQKYPEVKGRIDKIAFMGTSYHCGNPTVLSTFNVMVDPEAFQVLLDSGVDVYACPLDTTKTAYVTPDEARTFHSITGPAAEMVNGLFGGYCQVDTKTEVFDEHEEGERNAKQAARMKSKYEMHDPATVALVTNPELFTWNKYFCQVECKGELTLGYTIIDNEDYYAKDEDERNLYFAESIDREGFLRVFRASLEKFSR